jgi:xylan 1,4-beta-xylosidase
MQTLTGETASLSNSVAARSRVAAVRAVRVSPAWSGPRTPFRHTWEGIINVDQFRWMVRRDMQEQLEMAQRELRATHVRAVGMFDDEMRVFRESPAAFMGYEPKQPRTNWQTVNYVIDSMIDRGLQPVFTTSFIPSAMASGPVTVFSTNAHTSPPKDWAQWESFVRDAVQQAVDRYSLDVVRKWPFEVWNEPNLRGWFWGGDLADFNRLWETTYRAIKSVDSSLRVGGPSTGRAEWLEELIDFGQQHDCPPDYLITHIYNNDSAVDHPLAPFDPSAITRGSKSPTFATDIMRSVRALLDRRGFKGELHWNEWGRSFHAVDHHREHPSEAAFIARLLGEVSQEADVFSYWCLSDIYDQVGYGREAFFGGYGLLNLQGLRKPAYHAFELLAKLGTERVAISGDRLDSTCNAIVTSSGNRAHILVYASEHDDEPARQSVAITVNVPAGSRAVQLHRIDSIENNVITRWRELGAPVYLSRQHTKELADDNALKPSSSSVVVENGEAHFTMESPGIALLEIELPRTGA